jgi:hypothetical protein
MLNYQSVRSSEPQIRSNPALRHIGTKSGFQAKLTSIVESSNLPFPTFQLVKDASQPILQTKQMYAWIRPKQLRAQWLVLSDGLPLSLLDPKDSSRMYSIRIPFDKKQVQQLGPIICEAAWDAQEHVLWIFDVVFWEKQSVWSFLPYSKRWDLVKQVVGSILDCGHPMSDAEVQVPTWQSLKDLTNAEIEDPAFSIEFQPEQAGQRRHLFLLRDTRIAFQPSNHHERKMVSEVAAIPSKKQHFQQNQQRQQRQQRQQTPKGPVCAIVEDPDEEVVVEQPSEPLEPSQQYVVEQTQPPIIQVTKSTKFSSAILQKDPHSRVPDSYRLTSSTKEDLGLAAIRSLSMSKLLREALKQHPSVPVTIEWYEPFQKYSVQSIQTD